MRIPHQRGRRLFWPRSDAIRAAKRDLERGLPLVHRGANWKGRVRVIDFFGLDEGGLVPAGASTRRIAALKAWGTRRSVHGETGYTADGFARISQPKGRNQHTGRSHCARGHKFRPGSYWLKKDGGRQCKACRQIVVGRKRRGRLERAQLATRLEAARVAMIASGIKLNQQPDSPYWRGRFVAARERYFTVKGKAVATAIEGVV